MVGLVKPQSVEQEQNFILLAAADMAARGNATIGRAWQTTGQTNHLFAEARYAFGELAVKVRVGRWLRVLEPMQA